MRSMDQRGVTMVELMVAMVLMAVALLALAASIPYALYGVVASGFQTTATLLAQEAIERAKAADYRSMSSLAFDGSSGTPPTAAAPCAPSRGSPVQSLRRRPARHADDRHDDDHGGRGVQRVGPEPDLQDHGRDHSSELRDPNISRGAMSLLRDGRGLSLTELIVTLALFALVMVGVVGTWGKAQEAYFIGSETAEVQQNVRAAIDFMVREIRSGGRDATVCAFDYATSSTVDCDGAKVANRAARLAGTGTPTWQTSNGVGGPGCAGLYAIPFAQATATTLRIRSDRNHNGRIAGLGNALTSPASAADRGEEDVLYALSTANCPPGVPQCITRDDGTGPVAMVAVDINGLTFTTTPGQTSVPAPVRPTHATSLLGAADEPVTGGQHRADCIEVQAQQLIAGQTVSRTLVTEVTLRNRS